MSLLFGYYFNPYLSIGKMHNRYRAFLMYMRLRFLLLVQTMGDGDMPIAFLVDTCHLSTEEPTMRGGVLQLIDRNIIMNHLVQNGVLYQFFRQVNSNIYTQHKIFIFISPKQALPFAHKSDLTQESLGVAEFDRQGR